MNTRAFLALLLGLCVVTVAPAAETIESQLKAFQKTASAALAKNAGTSGERRGESSLYAIANLSQLTTTGANSNPQELERMIASVVALTQSDPEVTKAADALIATVRADRQARIDRARAEIDTLLKQAGEACLAAKMPADLDATLTALAPYGRNSGYDRRSDDQESWQRGSNAYRFVTRWQDYLAARSQRNANEATSILRDLSNSVDVAMMPRSALIALLTPPTASAQSPASTENPLAEIIPKLEAAKTFDDLIAITRSLGALFPNNQYQQNSLKQVLTYLIDDRQQVLAGTRPSSLYSDGNGRQLSAQDPAYTPAAQAALLAFHRQTQLAGIALSFPNTKLPAKADETNESYLIRFIEKFVADDDWLQVREALDLYRNFVRSSPPSWVSGDVEACSAYIAARNLDRAQQFPAAVASYQRALRSVGRYVPVEAISARLAEIKKTNPDAFTSSANQGTATPTTGRNSDLPPGHGASIPRSPDGLRPPAPTGPQTPAAQTAQTPSAR